MEGFWQDTSRVLFEPWAWLLVILFSALGVAGNLTLYELGKKGPEAVASRFPRIDPARWARAKELFEARGSWILLSTSLPGLGILLSTAAGAYGIRSIDFVLWTMVAKLARNWILLISAVNIHGLFAG
jgi:membrane protein YqaA with SNARE-associated domain